MGEQFMSGFTVKAKIWTLSFVLLAIMLATVGIMSFKMMPEGMETTSIICNRQSDCIGRTTGATIGMVICYNS